MELHLEEKVLKSKFSLSMEKKGIIIQPTVIEMESLKQRPTEWFKDQKHSGTKTHKKYVQQWKRCYSVHC